MATKREQSVPTTEHKGQRITNFGFTTLIVSFLVLQTTLSSGIAHGDPARDKQARSAAAFVCCDGSDDFAVCRGGELSDLLFSCVREHERDHLRWFRDHLPNACHEREAGARHFTMTPTQHRHLECRGYAREYSCLRRLVRQTDRTGLAQILKRQHRLQAKAKSTLDCDIASPTAVDDANSLSRKWDRP